jgi:hypothetical protein
MPLIVSKILKKSIEVTLDSVREIFAVGESSQEKILSPELSNSLSRGEEPSLLVDEAACLELKDYLDQKEDETDLESEPDDEDTNTSAKASEQRVCGPVGHDFMAISARDYLEQNKVNLRSGLLLK